MRYAAVVLAGGAARRMGGVAKPALAVAGRPMLARVLDAVADAVPRVVVAPAGTPVPDGVLLTCERPAGGGPVAAAAAGLAVLGAGPDVVALLAADLPFLNGDAVRALREALAADPGAAGACYVDGAGRPQWLCGAWRVAALAERLAAHGDPAGASMRAVLGPLPLVAVRDGSVRDGPAPGGPVRDGPVPGGPVRDGPAPGGPGPGGPVPGGPPVEEGGPPPWYDCDTDADLRRAERWSGWTG